MLACFTLELGEQKHYHRAFCCGGVIVNESHRKGVTTLYLNCLIYFLHNISKYLEMVKRNIILIYFNFIIR